MHSYPLDGPLELANLVWQMAGLEEQVRQLGEINDDFLEDNARYEDSPANYTYLTTDSQNGPDTVQHSSPGLPSLLGTISTSARYTRHKWLIADYSSMSSRRPLCATT